MKRIFYTQELDIDLEKVMFTITLGDEILRLDSRDFSILSAFLESEGYKLIQKFI